MTLEFKQELPSSARCTVEVTALDTGTFGVDVTFQSAIYGKQCILSERGVSKERIDEVLAYYIEEDQDYE